LKQEICDNSFTIQHALNVTHVNKANPDPC